MAENGQNRLRGQVTCWIAAVRTHYLVLLFFTLVVYFPRLCLSYFVFFLAQFLRLIARITGVATGRPVANRRILVITDYLPPQTHGIAIRCHAYVKEMRAKGHEVIVFSTAYEASKETSFDHPNIPAVVNPFNLKNRIGYNPGVKLAWFLGAHTWDVVHLVYPSLIGTFVLTTCAWRRIPVYCSHHVEMKMFAYKLVPIRWVASFGLKMYDILGLGPAVKWGTLNAAPTLCFARDHMGKENEAKLRRVPSGTHDVFTAVPKSDTERRDVRLSKFKVDSEDDKVILMVQRLSAEKGTERVFTALLPKEEGGQGVKGVLAIAGDGPAKESLIAEATRLRLRVADEVVQDVVERIQSGAQRCVAPSATVHPFGSTVNGFGEETSDLDVLVAIREEELSYYMSYASWAQRHQRLSEFLMQGDPAEPSLPTRITPKAAMCHAVQQLADFLPELGFQVLDLIPQARKPLVTVEDTKGPLKEVDVSINNSLPLYNSQLLKSYSKLDERVRPLVLLVKVWAKGKRVCGAGEGNLSSYSWTIMVIYFLQLVGILPSLQLLYKKSRSLQHVDYWGIPRSFETGFLSAEEYQQEVADDKLPPCEAKADLTVAQLLYGFVRFFDREYQWGSEAVSMRQPDRRDVGDWFRLFGSIHPEPAIHVEDPIEFRDLNIVLRRERLAQLKEEFNHAVEMLESGCSLEEFLTSEPRPDVVMTPFRTRRRFKNRRRYKSLELPRLPELK